MKAKDFDRTVSKSLNMKKCIMTVGQDRGDLALSQVYKSRYFPFRWSKGKKIQRSIGLPLVGVGGWEGPNVGCYGHCCRYLNLSTDMFLDISDMFSTQQYNMPNQFNHTSQIIYLENVVWSACRVLNTITWIIGLVCWHLGEYKLVLLKYSEIDFRT